MALSGVLASLGGEHGWLADLVPGMLALSARLCRQYPADMVEDLVMAGCCGALAARREHPAAPQAYLFGAARRAVLSEARALLWRGRAPGTRVHVPLLEQEHLPPRPAAAEPVAELSRLRARARMTDWQAAELTWGAGMSLAEAGGVLGASKATLHGRRERVRALLAG